MSWCVYGGYYEMGLRNFIEKHQNKTRKRQNGKNKYSRNENNNTLQNKQQVTKVNVIMIFFLS